VYVTRSKEITSGKILAEADEGELIVHASIGEFHT
jgi:hypothetical protein